MQRSRRRSRWRRSGKRWQRPARRPAYRSAPWPRRPAWTPATSTAWSGASARHLDEQATDALVVAGGGLPAALDRLGPLDPTVLLLADLLSDGAIPEQERADLRRIVVLLARRWRPGLAAE